VSAVQLEGAQRLIPDDPKRAAAMVATVREQVREALADLRRTVAALRTPLQADLPLSTALFRLISSFQGATGLTVHTTLPEELPDLPALHRLALYRAAQEALTNVQRHAQAHEVWFELNQGDQEISLLVGDDGRGIGEGAEMVGFGLRGLRERTVQLGGKLDLESRPGGGTQLRFCLPLPAEEADA
jgi:two-component system sensor histidine kinase UhpB